MSSEAAKERGDVKTMTSCIQVIRNTDDDDDDDGGGGDDLDSSTYSYGSVTLFIVDLSFRKPFITTCHLLISGLR